MSTPTQDDAIALMLCFKPADLRSAMEAIARAALDERKPLLWPDETDFSKVPADARNAVGNSFKVLARAGVIRKTTIWRNSKVAAQKGRIVFAWTLGSAALARAFLKAHDLTPMRGQMEMAI
jgi:hypothetical protein